MNNIDINDTRLPKDFAGISFSGYKKADVKRELLKAINNNKIEDAFNWSGELICAGHYLELWENIILISCKNIHLGNPKLPIYLNMRFSIFKDIIHNGYVGNELAMRNNQKIRTLFAEIITVLCISNKKPSFENIKIKKEEFDMMMVRSKVKAPSIEYASKILKSGDPKELFLAINELVYNIEKKDTLLSCYWIEWIMEFDSMCRKKKDILNCEYRNFVDVDDKFKKDVIWIVWDTLFYFCVGEIQNKILNNLLFLFMIKYNYASKKKRRYLLYFAVEIVTENVDLTLDMISDFKIVKQALSKINVIYKSIKKNEHAPKTDYLFKNVNQRSNLEKTIEKLDKLNSIFKH